MSGGMEGSPPGGVPVRAMHAPAPSLAMSAGQVAQLQQHSQQIGQQDISERMKMMKIDESNKAAAQQQQQQQQMQQQQAQQAQAAAAVPTSDAPTALSPTGAPKKKEMGAVRYAAERVIGNGSFGVVYQATVIETGETVAIKKVLQARTHHYRRACSRRKQEPPDPRAV